MGHLTPQLRADRNGKLVTRHIKGEAAPSASKRAFAAPTIAKQGEFTQREIEKARPLRKVKKRKVDPNCYIAELRSGSKIPLGTTVEVSDEALYPYFRHGLTIDQAIGLYSIGVEPYEALAPIKQMEGEETYQFNKRLVNANLEFKRVESRSDRFREVSHRLEMLNVPAETASKCLANGMRVRDLRGYITEEEAVEVFSKVTVNNKNQKTLEELVDGIIPMSQYRRFGIRKLLSWRTFPGHREMDDELIQQVVDYAANNKGRDGVPEESLLKIAHREPRLFDIKDVSLMWHEHRPKREGGAFNYEEARIVDDFISYVRDNGITFANMPPTSPSVSWQCAKILDWRNAGITNEQIVLANQNGWSKEQAVGVFTESLPSAMADGIL